MVSEAAKAGQLHILKWMYYTCPLVPWTGYAHENEILAYAHEDGHTEMVEWLQGVINPVTAWEYWPAL